jgi:hypothetical protein
MTLVCCLYDECERSHAPSQVPPTFPSVRTATAVGALAPRVAPVTDPETRRALVSWAPPASMTLSEWLACGHRLGVIGRGIGWWIGDWVNYGNAQYGEKYARAARVTGYDVQSLMNMAYVASRVPPGRRISTLSWSHHAEVAPLEPAEQASWLNRAVKEKLSVRCLRTELRQFRRRTDVLAPDGNGDTIAVAASSASTVCPHCGSQLNAT